MIQTLHKFLPSSSRYITSISTLTADNVLKSLDEEGVRYHFVRLSSGDWEIEASEASDRDILEMLHMNDAGHAGELIVCTEACSRYGYAPFRCQSEQLEQFIDGYDFEMFFDGDVVILCQQTRTMTVFHHAGGFVHVQLSP